MRTQKATHAVSQRDFFLYARSFHRAAQNLAAAFQPEASLLPDADASPVVFMYRHALELHLKAIVLGDGGNFLATRPDPISVGKTHSVSWLAQFVVQIVTALGWQSEFRCEGIETPADFKVAVEQVSFVDPGSYISHSPIKMPSIEHVRAFAQRMDALIGMLAATGDGLAAEWDLRSDGADVDAGWDGGGFGPTIH